MKNYFLSAFMHIALLIVITLGGGSGGDAPKGDSEVHSEFASMPVTTIQERDKPVEVSLVERSDDQEAELQLTKKKEMVNTDQKCPNFWYGGIGVMTEGRSIVKVYRGYAADAAGLLVGDKIGGISEPQILGTPGTMLYMTIDRNGQLLHFSIMRVKVCYYEPE